jgi:hypothetical protein
VNQFNTQQAIARQTRNVGASNQAQAANLATQQQIADYNTQAANQELLRQNQAKQQEWLDSMYKNQAIAAAQQGQAGQFNKSAAGTAQGWQNIGAGLGGIGNAYANYAAKQKASGGGTGDSGDSASNSDNSQSQTTQFWEGGEVSDESQDDIAQYLKNHKMYQGGKVSGYAGGGEVESNPLAEGINSSMRTNSGSQPVPPSQPQQDPSQMVGYNKGCYVEGGQVDGKAKVAGDSPKNDTVTAKLSPGEIVIPRSHTGSVEEATAFLKRIMKNKS